MRDARAMLVIGSCALAAVAVTAIATRHVPGHANARPSWPASAPTTNPTHDSSLDLTIDQIRYRFEVRAAQAFDPLATLDELEARVSSSNPGALDLAELADLYLRRSGTSGDHTDLARAEQTAKRSLALLPSPNSAQLTLARVATARHEFRDAIRLARDYFDRTGSASAYTVLATSYLALGELPAAAASAEAQVSERPSTSAYVQRALVYQAQGRDAEAAHDFARAVVVEDFGDVNEAARLRTLWARFAIRRGDLSSAKLLISEALRVVPDDPFALAQRGELALRAGDARAAGADFERAFASSREVRYLMDQARAQELAGDSAAATFTRALVEKLVRAELAPTEVATTSHGHRHEGDAHAGHRHEGDAHTAKHGHRHEGDAHTAKHGHRHEGDAHAAKHGHRHERDAHAAKHGHRHEGDAHAAKHAHRHALDTPGHAHGDHEPGEIPPTGTNGHAHGHSHEPGSTGHTLDLVEILVDRGTPSDLADAITLGTEELTRRASADVRFQLARAYHRAGRPSEGIVQIRAALATGARDARIYEIAARLEAAMGNTSRADLYLRQANVLDPGNRGWRHLGMAVVKGAAASSDASAKVGEVVP
ncbi:MAG: tetratricopeptide repeat protein [Kofleriaceae bacterium]